MFSLVHPLWRRLDPVSVSCIAFSFWALAVLVHIKLQVDVINAVVLLAVLACCLLLLSFVNIREWRDIGTPGILILAAMAFYLFIGVGVSLVVGAELEVRDVARQGFFFVVTLAAILGGRSLLERIGFEALLKWLLVVLAASCVVIALSPVLWDLGVLPSYRLPYRVTGTFSDPNDAGFIAVMTATLALVFLYNDVHGVRRSFAYLALVLGYTTTLLTGSHTSFIVLGATLLFFLLLNGRLLAQDFFRSCLVILGVVGIFAYFAINIQAITIVPFQQPETDVSIAETPVSIPEAQPEVNPSLGMDTDEIGVRGEDGLTQVGKIIVVYLVRDKYHRADDKPYAIPWKWQYANALATDSNTPNDATWTDIPSWGYPSYGYTPTDDDSGKFLRAYVDYEKGGVMQRAQTPAIGPIAAAPVVDANADPSLPELTAEDTIGLVRGGNFSARMLLWEMGVEKALESPIVGHGLYQLHYMEGARIGHHGRPTGVHNVYLMLIGEAGIIPLALYVLALLFLFRVLWTMPKHPARDLIAGWVVVMALFGVTFQHLLTQGAYNFLIGLTCALAAFLAHRQKEQIKLGYSGDAQTPESFGSASPRGRRQPVKVISYWMYLYRSRVFVR